MIEVSSSFDDLRASHVRLLQEAAKRGPVRVCLWSDDLVLAQTGAPPKFPLAERRYFVQAIRFVDEVEVVEDLRGLADLEGLSDARDLPGLPDLEGLSDARDLRGLADLEGLLAPRKKVLVTGSFDWLHSGHVRFFEEVSALGRVYAVVGHDANIRLLKGEGHPLIAEAERLYMVASLRYVHRAMLSTGHGWLDAEPEIERLRPDIYAVNEDGDKPEKRTYCEAHGIEYVVLPRQPKDGLPRRSSTELRGF